MRAPHLGLARIPSAQVVGVLKKEVMKTQSKDLEKGAEYRQLLVQAIHSWCDHRTESRKCWDIALTLCNYAGSVVSPLSRASAMLEEGQL